MNNFKPTDNGKTAIRVPTTDLTKPMEAGIEAIKGAQALMRQFGKQVEPALYSLLCDTHSENRTTVDKALKNGTQAASAVLIPLLISQFAIAPAIATMVAAVTIQAIATVGQEKLCRSLAQAGADKQLAANKQIAANNLLEAHTAPTPAEPELEAELESEPKSKAKARSKAAKPANKLLAPAESEAGAEPKPKTRTKAAKPASKPRVNAKSKVKKAKPPAKKKSTK